MSAAVENPFDSIESAHDFVTLLAATIDDAKRDLEADIEREGALDVSRRLEALRLALFNLEKLEMYMHRSGRVLNDLRTLRRLLFQERTSAEAVKRESRPTSKRSAS